MDRSRPEPPRGPASVVVVAGAPGEGESVQAFFRRLEPNGRVGFALALSLAPADLGAWARDLAGRLSLPLELGREGSALRSGRILLVPPQPPLDFREGRLVPAEPGAARRNVERLFRSLARERGKGTLAVLLAGTGRDGIRGARAVRDRGGRVLVQDPRTARFPAMPYGMALAGLGERLRSPEGLAEDLRNHLLGHPVPDPPVEPGPVRDILDRLLDRAGVDFRVYRTGPLLRRIGHRMRLLGYHDLLQYHSLLGEDPREAGRLLQDLLANATSFYRNPEAFRELRERVLAPLARGRDPRLPIRIWVPGCATGEEAYSLAMLVLEELAAHGRAVPVRVYATDIDPEALGWARKGWYPGSAAGPVGPDRFAAFFQPAESGGCRVTPVLRQTVAFARHNLLTDPPLCGMDLVSCRNLLSYLDPEVQPRILRLLNFALAPGGTLFLGQTEIVRPEPGLFQPLSARARIFRRIGPGEPFSRPGSAAGPARAKAGVPPAAALRDLLETNESLHRALDGARARIEELQAANEGLMAAAEEVQATNEELNTANEVLLRQMERLHRVCAERGDLLRASGLAALLLDGRLRIRGFTPAMARFLHLAPGDRGRPVAHLALIPDREHLAAVLTSGVPGKLHLSGLDGQARWLRVRPLRFGLGRADGLLVTLEGPGSDGEDSRTVCLPP